jgi:hypothetical protein
LLLFFFFFLNNLLLFKSNKVILKYFILFGWDEKYFPTAIGQKLSIVVQTTRGKREKKSHKTRAGGAILTGLREFILLF